MTPRDDFTDTPDAAAAYERLRALQETDYDDPADLAPGPSNWDELFGDHERPDPSRLPKSWRQR